MDSDLEAFGHNPASHHWLFNQVHVHKEIKIRNAIIYIPIHADDIELLDTGTASVKPNTFTGIENKAFEHDDKDPNIRISAASVSTNGHQRRGMHGYMYVSINIYSN